MQIGINDRELATMLAALRYWQAAMQKAADRAGPKRAAAEFIAQSKAAMPMQFDGFKPLGPAAIDTLCERINGGLNAQA